jgi:hypothetical protein
MSAFGDDDDLLLADAGVPVPSPDAPPRGAAAGKRRRRRVPVRPPARARGSRAR